MFAKFHSRDIKLIVLLAVIAAAALGTSWYGGQKLEREILIHDATTEAVRWATYLEENFDNLEQVLTDGRTTPADDATIAVAQDVGGVFRYKMFDPDGVIILASRSQDLGQTNTKPYFSAIVQQGGTYAKLEEDEAFGGDRQVVSEAYVPFMDRGRFRGAIEVYVDDTARADILHTNIRAAQWGLVGVLALMGIAFAAVISHNIRNRNRDYDAMAEANGALARAEAEVRSLNEGLEQRVEERSAELSQKNAQINEAYERITGLNEDLLKGKAELERRVDERTADLERVNEQLLRMTERMTGAGYASDVAA